MSFTSKVLSFALLSAALAAACSDASSPTQAFSASAAPLASKGGTGGSGGGGGGGGGGGSVTQLVVNTPPTVDATGTWIGTTDGPDVTHTYTFTLTQTGAGIVSGVTTSVTPFVITTASVVGTVNGDTLMLYVGTLCGSCTLTPSYRGMISQTNSQMSGTFLSGGVSPLTLFKQ